MPNVLEPDICVIGAGSGGLSVAAAAAQFGVPVVLVEKARMGGDCLNYGCVPSKSLLAAGKRAHAMRTAGAFGIAAVEPSVDWQAVHDHVQSVIAAIAPNDSAERFEGLGVTVIREHARFTGEDTVMAGGHEIRARRFVIATGSSPAVPPIAGLDAVPYFTNETIFENTGPIAHLIVIGGGPIGMEMAQAHRRLGARVTVLEAATALAKDDPEVAAVVLKALRGEGIDIFEKAAIERIEAAGEGVRVHLSGEGGVRTIAASHLLVATGRAPNIADLGLEAAGIGHTKRGIEVDGGLRTSNGHVYAIGDVAGGLQFTHVANYHAGIVIRNALFRLPVKADTSTVPWVTYTEPELAHVGLTEAEAAGKHARIRVLRWPFEENDRAQAERTTTGFVKAVTTKSGRILGATIAGEGAGEQIQLWVLAIANKMKIKALTGIVLPYPTLSEASKRVAYTYYTPSLTDKKIRGIIRFLAKFG